MCKHTPFSYTPSNCQCALQPYTGNLTKLVGGPIGSWFLTMFSAKNQKQYTRKETGQALSTEHFSEVWGSCKQNSQQEKHWEPVRVLNRSEASRVHDGRFQQDRRDLGVGLNYRTWSYTEALSIPFLTSASRLHPKHWPLRARRPCMRAYTTAADHGHERVRLTMLRCVLSPTASKTGPFFQERAADG